MGIKKSLEGLTSFQRVSLVIALSALSAFLWFTLVSNIETSLNGKNADPFEEDPVSALECLEAESQKPICIEREMALQKIKLFQELKINLMNLNIEQWADTEFKDLLALVSEADKLFKKDSFSGASIKYIEAILSAQQLIEISQISLKEFIENGYNYLLLNNWKEAEDSFRKALIIQANNINANTGLSRAMSLEKVLNYLNEANLLINANSLDEARDLILNAFNLDNENIQTQEARFNVNQLIRQRDLDILIQRGYSLLQNLQFKEASVNFNRALLLDKNSHPATMGLIEVAEGIKKVTIRDKKILAQASFELEDFSTSLSEYKSILDIDKNLSFAALGLDEVNNFIAAEKNLDRYLDNPERLSSAAVFNEAQQFLVLLGPYKLRERLFSKEALLQSLLTKYSEILKLTISSDNKTKISIVNGRELGTFVSKELRLSKGTYTFIGKRKGYITIRQVFNLSESSSLWIACNKKI